MDSIKLHIDKTFDFVSQEAVFKYKAETEKHNKALHEKTGKGSDFLGWVTLPSSITPDEIKEIQETAQSLKNNSDVVVIIGIGGSYLGAKAVIDALSHTFSARMPQKNPLVVFAGQNISEDYLADLQDMLHEVNWSMVVISKSGTTTEPAIAFRVLRENLEKKYGREQCKNRIVAITDASKGALRQLADEEGYKTYVIPDDVGGRFSVLTPVGLVPIAIAGYNIQALVEGARDMQIKTEAGVPFEENLSARYAAVRNELYKKGKTTEILVNYNPKLHFVAEWWKQLYGESEGKEGKGIYPSSVDFTTDLHSMGQYIQEGLRNIFETVLSVQSTSRQVIIPNDESNLDKLNYLAGKRFDDVNKMAELGTLLAHMDGGVPNIRVEIPSINEFYLGQLMYFFEKACGISGYILGVNPFDQPGVEAYKKNMFALLEKPGFEEETNKIKTRL